MRFRSLRSPISLLSLLVAAFLGVGLALTACTVGEVPGSGDQATFIDDNGDGTTDAVDADGDGQTDFTIADCAFCEPQATVRCKAPFIDENGDRIPDGLDTDCDGKIDIRFGGRADGNGGAATNSCVANSTVNGTKFGISCKSSNGGPSTCECRRNDQLIQTCTQAANGCSLSVTNGVVKAGCCQF